MNTRIAMGLALALGLAMTTPVWAAPEIMKTEKLSFAPGGSQTAVQGSVQGKGVVDYKVFVPQGQLLSISMAADVREIHFNVLTPDGTAKIFDGSISGNQSEDPIPQAGEYIVRVYLSGRMLHKLEPTRFRLDVRIKQAG